MSVASPSYPTSLPTLHHLMLKSPLHVSTPIYNLLLDPYCRDFSYRHVTNGSTSPTLSSTLAHLHPSHRTDCEEPNTLGLASSSSTSSPPRTSPPSSIERESRRASSSLSLRQPNSVRGAPLSRRANACHNCRIRKTRCVPSNDRQTVNRARSSSSSSSSPSRTGSIAPCTRCTSTGVPCEYPNTREDRVEMQSRRKSHRVRDERDLEDLGHWLVPNSSSRRPVRSTFNELKHRDAGGRTARIDGDHIGDAMAPLSIDEAIPAPSPFISQRPRGDVCPKTIAFDP
jgi:hypothetical protein